MYYVKMTFTPFAKTEMPEEGADGLAGLFWGFLRDLSSNGQAYNSALTHDVHDSGVFSAFFFMPEVDTMKEINRDGPVSQGFAEIEKHHRITTEILGRDVEGHRLCDCGEPSWYFLRTLALETMSPIICGDCRGMIPTYKFNRTEAPKGHASYWQYEYDMIEKLWYGSSFDGFTYRQQSSPKSQLSKFGREICAAYEKALGKPFYYFLFHFSYSGRMRGKKCPVCGKDWTLKEDIGILSYKCDRCRLVSC